MTIVRGKRYVKRAGHLWPALESERRSALQASAPDGSKVGPGSRDQESGGMLPVEKQIFPPRARATNVVFGQLLTTRG